MRKYRIYSGAKPTSADKTFAVNWGGKYFTVSPTSEKQVISSSVKITNPNTFSAAEYKGG